MYGHDGPTLVDALQRHAVDVLLTVGGNGTMRAAGGIVDEIARRGARLAVVAVPKTIDDDIARHAVHAAMAGRTGVLIGRCHGVYAHIPIELAIKRMPQVDDDLWYACAR